MAIKEFTVGVKHHVNIGDYESMEIQASVTFDDVEDEFAIVRKLAQNALSTLLADSFQAQKNPEWFKEITRKKFKIEAKTLGRAV